MKDHVVSKILMQSQSCAKSARLGQEREFDSSNKPLLNGGHDESLT